MKKIAIDIDTYERLLDNRRAEFWVAIPDELWDFAIQNHLFDLIKHYGDPDPMVIVDNLAVNTEWCTAENFNDKEAHHGKSQRQRQFRIRDNPRGIHKI